MQNIGAVNTPKNKEKIQFYRPMMTRKELELVLEALIEDQLYPGGVVQRLEKEFSDAYEFSHAFALISYQAGIEMILKSIPEGGGHVLASSLYPRELFDVCTAMEIELRVLDIDKDSLHPSIEAWESYINEDTRAVFLHYPYGAYADYSEWIHYTKEKMRNIMIIEDISPLTGMETDNVYLGHSGDAAIINLDYEMPITTGKGSIILTDKNSFAKSIKSNLRQFSYSVKRELPGKSLLDVSMVDYTAAMGLEQLNMADISLSRRKKIASIYQSAIDESYFESFYRYSGVDAASGFPVSFDRDIDYVKRYFSSLNIEISSIKKPLHYFLGKNPMDFKNIEKAMAKSIILPAYAALSRLNIERIAASVKGFF